MKNMFNLVIFFFFWSATGSLIICWISTSLTNSHLGLKSSHAHDLSPSRKSNWGPIRCPCSGHPNKKPSKLHRKGSKFSLQGVWWKFWAETSFSPFFFNLTRPGLVLVCSISVAPFLLKLSGQGSSSKWNKRRWGY